VHSSDLLDPTPFLEQGHVLLITGGQFTADADLPEFRAYAERLVRRGVVALGFGTELVRSGTPEEVTAATRACVRAGGGHRHIVNLNHGVDRATPVANFEAYVRAARNV